MEKINNKKTSKKYRLEPIPQNKATLGHVSNVALSTIFKNPENMSNSLQRTASLQVLGFNKNKMSKDDKKRILAELFNTEPILRLRLLAVEDPKIINELYELFLTSKDGNMSIKAVKKILSKKGSLMPIEVSEASEGSGISKSKLLGFEKGKYPKKYNAIIEVNGKQKKIAFGHQDYEQYKDSTGLNIYSDLDHLDKKRRELYYKRHNKDYPFPSADYFSKRFLW